MIAMAEEGGGRQILTRELVVGECGEALTGHNLDPLSILPLPLLLGAE